MSIAFLNGLQADMLYPPDLGLEKMGIQPSGHILLRRGAKAAGGQTTVSFVGGDAEPQTARTSPVQGEPSDTTSGLSMYVACWQIDIAGSLTPSEQKAFLDNLSGSVTRSGFLMLTAQPPLHVCDTDECGPGQPELWVGEDITLRAGCGDLGGKLQRVENGIEVYRHKGGFTVWCDATRSITVGVTDRRLADSLIEALTFRKVRRR